MDREVGGLQSMMSQRVRLSTEQLTFSLFHLDFQGSLVSFMLLANPSILTMLC